MGTPLGPKYVPYTYMGPLGEVPGSACGDANRHPWDATADGGCPPGASGTGRGEGCSCKRRGAGSPVSQGPCRHMGYTWALE